MHATIRRDRVAEPVRRDEVAQRLAEGLVPLLRHTAGFVAAYVVATEDAHVVCVARFADAVGAAEGARWAAKWDGRHVDVLVSGPPEIHLGEVWEGLAPVQA